MNRLRCFVVLACFVFPAASFAALRADVVAPPTGSRSASFGVQASFGYLTGQAKEHVYDYDGVRGARRQLSRLDWDLEGILMGGVNGTLRVADRLTFNAGFWIPLTEGDGQMEDYDWENVHSSRNTHYSLSDVDVTEGYIFDLNMAFDVFRNDWFTGRIYAGYKQDGWVWEDHGIYLLYPEYGYVPYYLHGEHTIRYEQEISMPYIGASADLVWGGLTLSAYCSYSPLVYAKDWDDHLSRGLHFEEEFEHGDMFAAGVSARYAFENGFFVSAAVDYQVIDRIIGDMYVADYVEREYGFDEDVAGLENEYLVFSLGCGLRF